MQIFKLWDLPVRLFHWLLVLALGALWYTGETGDYMEWHMHIGVFVLAMILARLVWGVIGSSNARFGAFLDVRGALVHLRKLFKREPEIHPGHNPLGGWMVLLMLVLLLLQPLTGLFTTDDIFTEGPLTRFVSSDTAGFLSAWHKRIFLILQIAAGLHVLAIVFYLTFKKTNLIRAMVRGSTYWPGPGAPPVLNFRPTWLALVVFVVFYTILRVALYLLADWP
ncbi:MAG: cytochrome b/b6 domain-containing protein [Gammaproteobacteria bacterium]|nr:cytochrome b/b6 domain-containing protein [Gammaproteobacteria bacterium]